MFLWRMSLWLATVGMFATPVIARPAQDQVTTPEKIEVPESGATVPMLNWGGRPMVSNGVAI
jgi:hypothetical protein